MKNIINLKVNNIGISVIGIGGAGGKVINYLINKGFPKEYCIYIDTNEIALKVNSATNKYFIEEFGSKVFELRKYNMIDKSIMKVSQNEINRLISGSRIIFIVSGLGGYTGTFWTPIFTNIAKNSYAIVIVIAIKSDFSKTPKMKNQIKTCINEIRKLANSFLIINVSLNQIKRRKKDPVSNWYIDIYQIIYETITGISEIYYKDIENVKNESLLNLLKDAGELFIGTGIGRGENRYIYAIEKAISNPYLKINNIKDAKNVIVIVSGDRNPKLLDIAFVFKHIEKSFSKNSEISLISYFDEKLTNEIEVTIIAAGFG
jgi:cell division protein FtsZ